MNTKTNKGTCLAVDLGGTKLLIGEVDSGGQLLRSKKYKTGYLTQTEGTKVIFEALDDYIAAVGWINERPGYMGMGMIGQVDYINANWLMIDPSRKENIPIGSLIKDKYHFDIRIENDVKAATLAEKAFGTGKADKDFIYLNIGTGIAAGFIADGRLLRGWENDSGEIGHIVVDIDSDVECECGRLGCLEAIASGRGMYKRALGLREKHPDSQLFNFNEDDISAKKIITAAGAGDTLASKIADEAAAAITCGIMNLIRVTNPERIILGGGVMADGWMYRQILDRIGKKELGTVKKGIVLSELNPGTVGIIGAAAVGFGFC
ncbi:MAG: hypothetical protein K0R50_2109 [Eubacterium sp.]|jgi:predicted NBD/HSP70 family sugar kinase|nr:hypothetical protein [Eubacterium sp.]